MNKLIKIGLTALMLASFSLLSACSSTDKKVEDDDSVAEQALVDQTQDLMANDDDSFSNDEELAEGEEVASFDDDEVGTTEESGDVAETSALDETDSLDEEAPLEETASLDEAVVDESDLGATSSGLGH